jgi:hypothetical protein
MNYKTVFSVRSLASLAVIAGLAAASVPAFSQSAPDGRSAGNPNYDRSRRPAQAPPAGRYDKMAERLKITPAQQSVWQQYRRAVDDKPGTRPTQPPENADAVALLRWRADRSMDSAQRMAAIADATDVLQRSLDGEQRKILNEMIQQEFQGMREAARDATSEPRRSDSRPSDRGSMADPRRSERPSDSRPGSYRN